MNIECGAIQLEFQGLGTRRVQGAFDGGHISSDGASLLLRELDLRLAITERLAGSSTAVVHLSADVIFVGLGCMPLALAGLGVYVKTWFPTQFEER